MHSIMHMEVSSQLSWVWLQDTMNINKGPISMYFLRVAFMFFHSSLVNYEWGGDFIPHPWNGVAESSVSSCKSNNYD